MWKGACKSNVLILCGKFVKKFRQTTASLFSLISMYMYYYGGRIVYIGICFIWNMCGIWAIFGSTGDVSVLSNEAHKISHRGPDAFRLETIHHFPNCCLGFHRLAIMDDLNGMQPMRICSHPHIWLIYNGEIYNYKLIQKQFGFNYVTNCDGEAIIHLFASGGIEFAAKHLDGIFGFCLLDTSTRKVYLGRDTFGVKPVFRATNNEGLLAVCSEAKGLMTIMETEVPRPNIDPVLPGHVEVYSLDRNGNATLNEQFSFNKIGQAPAYQTLVCLDNDMKNNIRKLLEDAVTKRLMAERRIGCYLSGGLDSSLVAALLMKKAKEIGLKYPIQTFSIGMEGSPDLEAAEKVAKHIGSEHHVKKFTTAECFEVLEKVIYHLEMYDVINIRSAIGLYLISRYIKETTDTKVVLSGEGADEVMQGYIFFHDAPCPSDGENESFRLCNDLYMFDVLRADRCSAAWGLELRVPFLDHTFSSYFLSLPAELKAPQKGKEKYFIRSAFDGSGLLPDEILWRQKEGFSDGISPLHRSLYEVIQEHVAVQISDEELKQASLMYTHNPPKTKEGLLYRRIFEKYYPNQGKWMPYFWMPKWSNGDEPSSRKLKHYKKGLKNFQNGGDGL